MMIQLTFLTEGDYSMIPDHYNPRFVPDEFRFAAAMSAQVEGYPDWVQHNLLGFSPEGKREKIPFEGCLWKSKK